MKTRGLRLMDEFCYLANKINLTILGAGRISAGLRLELEKGNIPPQIRKYLREIVSDLQKIERAGKEAYSWQATIAKVVFPRFDRGYSKVSVRPGGKSGRK